MASRPPGRSALARARRVVRALALLGALLTAAAAAARRRRSPAASGGGEMSLVPASPAPALGLAPAPAVLPARVRSTGGSPSQARVPRTREELYREAQAIGLKGRSRMTKAELERALGKAGR